MSFTGELSNELLYLYPDKVIIIARENLGDEDEPKIKKNCPSSILNASLAGLTGYGGGHEYACGCCVKKEQFEHSWKI
jgi:hypothetical protein